MKFKKTDIGYLNSELKSLKEKIEAIPFFKKLDKERQNLIRKGKISSLLTQNEIVLHRNINVDRFRGMYKLFSTHTHSSPSSIKMLGFSKLQDIEDKLNTTLTLLTIEYCSCFMAATILNTGRLWKIRFAKKESAKIVRKYSRRLNTK